MTSTILRIMLGYGSSILSYIWSMLVIPQGIKPSIRDFLKGRIEFGARKIALSTELKHNTEQSASRTQVLSHIYVYRCFRSWSIERTRGAICMKNQLWHFNININYIIPTLINLLFHPLTIDPIIQLLTLNIIPLSL